MRSWRGVATRLHEPEHARIIALFQTIMQGKTACYTEVYAASLAGREAGYWQWQLDPIQEQGHIPPFAAHMG